MNSALKNDEFCISNDGFCIQNDVFCISNGESRKVHIRASVSSMGDALELPGMPAGMSPSAAVAAAAAAGASPSPSVVSQEDLPPPPKSVRLHCNDIHWYTTRRLAH